MAPDTVVFVQCEGSCCVPRAINLAIVIVLLYPFLQKLSKIMLQIAVSDKLKLVNICWRFAVFSST